MREQKESLFLFGVLGHSLFLAMPKLLYNTTSASQKMQQQAWNHSFISSSSSSTLSFSKLLLLLLLHDGVDRSQHYRGWWNSFFRWWFFFSFLPFSLWHKHFSFSHGSSSTFCVLGALARLCRPSDLSAEERECCCVHPTGTLWAGSGFSGYCLQYPNSCVLSCSRCQAPCKCWFVSGFSYMGILFCLLAEKKNGFLFKLKICEWPFLFFWFFWAGRGREWWSVLPSLVDSWKWGEVLFMIYEHLILLLFCLGWEKFLRKKDISKLLRLSCLQIPC